MLLHCRQHLLHCALHKHTPNEPEAFALLVKWLQRLDHQVVLRQLSLQLVDLAVNIVELHTQLLKPANDVLFCLELLFRHGRMHTTVNIPYFSANPSSFI